MMNAFLTVIVALKYPFYYHFISLVYWHHSPRSISQGTSRRESTSNNKTWRREKETRRERETGERESWENKRVGFPPWATWYGAWGTLIWCFCVSFIHYFFIFIFSFSNRFLVLCEKLNLKKNDEYEIWHIYRYPADIYPDLDNVLHFSVMFIYEEYHQTDFIQDFKETDTFADHFVEMFPDGNFLEWDQERKYKREDLEIYFEANCCKPVSKPRRFGSKEKKLIKVRPTTTLRKALQHEGYPSSFFV